MSTIKYKPKVMSLGEMILDQANAAKRAKHRLHIKKRRDIRTDSERVILNIIHYDYNGTWIKLKHKYRGKLRDYRKKQWDPILEILKLDPRIKVVEGKRHRSDWISWIISVNYDNIH